MKICFDSPNPNWLLVLIRCSSSPAYPVTNAQNTPICVVCLFDSAHGPFVLALVGATIVGSMATVWHGVVNPPRPGRLREWRYDDQQLRFGQGDEIGRFLLGSTVVMLFPKDTLKFNADWSPQRPIRMGEKMGERPDCC